LGQSKSHHWMISLFLFILMILSAASSVQAEASPSPPQRLKIGLALGGGSAGGFAHIGVLKWLEENMIPVDYIAGTSMGGLMGGCYAMGMNPPEIRNLVGSIDWNEFFNPVLPYDQIDFRRKEDRQNYPLFELGLQDGKLRLPNGMSMYQVDMVLSRVTLKYSLIKNFDELPIPFKCTATDIRNSQPVVLENGSLKKALRATMAIPGVFSPVEHDNQLLIDGGFLNNIPVETVKQMGADVVIAVNIAAPTQNHQTESIDMILLKSIDTVFAHNVKRSTELADIVLEPSLAEMGLLKWNAYDRYIELGYQAANKQAVALRKYSVDESAWRQYLRERRQRCRIDTPVPQGVVVVNTTKTNESAIERRLQTYIGKPVNTGLLEKDLTSILGSGLYESLSYEFAFKSNQPVLLIIAKEKTYGPPFISFAINSLYNDNSAITTAARITSFNVAGPNSELRLDLGIGSEAYLSGELYKPISGSNWFIAPSGYIADYDSGLTESHRLITNYTTMNSGLRFDLGYTVNQFSEVRLGYDYGYQKIRVTVGDPLETDFNGTTQKAELKWTFSSADNIALPRKGLTIHANACWYFEAPGSLAEFGLLEDKVLWNIPMGKNNSIFIFLAGGISYGSDPPLPQQFKLGGPFRLGAYHLDEFHGSNYLLNNLGYLKCIGKLSGKNVYLGIWTEYGTVYEEWPERIFKNNLSMGILSPTLIGPAFVNISFDKHSNWAFSMGLGRIF
jgi:NTE family protein